ncbi:MAG: haloacid dehalogenase-like hydrolase [Ardenticatenaceae bacterium]|nr:haloacid dehalogenase-like hydrolase [Ardenticatenaceae bacterium]MCB9445276.1 haloacid dehalogenase-like hydrolase [Ardenticatenaceae bacterium]
MKLLLFDIDGTLIRSHGAGRETMSLALTELFGTAGPIDDYKMSGKTDPRIITDLLLAAGFSLDEINSKLPDVYRLMTENGRIIFHQRDMQPCPGVLPLLESLRCRSNVTLGLVTGNIDGTAPLKLAAAGIDPAQFRLGAYGSDSLERNMLPGIAMQRATDLTGYQYTGNNTVVIGDTPADILCARAGRATAVAVASGWHATHTLARYQPDHLLENFNDTEKVLDILLNGTINREI